VSRELEPIIPAPLAEALRAPSFGPEGTAFQLLSVRPDGWPHSSMLSVGELVLRTDRDLRLALWPASSATANITATGRATLVTVVDGVLYSLRLSLGPPTRIPSEQYGYLAAFDAHVEEVRVDAASYADVLSGIRFRLHEPEDVVQRWVEMRAALLES
jgi:hypothetical protein